MGSPDPCHLIHAPQPDQRACLIWVTQCCKRSQCCAVKVTYKQAVFLSCVEQEPWGSPGRGWKSSGTTAQWTPQLKDPWWPHMAPRMGLPREGLCFAGWAMSPAGVSLPVSKEPPTDTTANSHALTGTVLRDRSREVLCPGPPGLTCWGRFACYPIILQPPVTLRALSPPSYPTVICPCTGIRLLLKFHLPCW